MKNNEEKLRVLLVPCRDKMAESSRLQKDIVIYESKYIREQGKEMTNIIERTKSKKSVTELSLWLPLIVGQSLAVEFSKHLFSVY